MAQWIRPRTLNGEVPSSNLLAAAVVPLDKAIYPHCLVWSTTDPAPAPQFDWSDLNREWAANDVVIRSNPDGLLEGTACCVESEDDPPCDEEPCI